MDTCRAAVLEQFNAPLETRRFPLPRELEPGAALAQTEMAGICGTDVHLWKGELPVKLPLILGHETVGRLVRLGEGLDRDWSGEPLRVGDRVTWTSTHSCGRCFYCARKRQPTRCPSRRAYGIGYSCDEPPHLWGGYSEYHYLRPGSHLFKLPDHLATESVAGGGCALVTAIHGVERICLEPSSDRPENPDPWPRLPELWRDSVVIQGAGPVGISCLAVAKKAGAHKVIVIGSPPARLALARRFGADETIALTEFTTPAARLARVRELTGGHGADVVLECAGVPAAVPEGIELCRDGAKYLILGHYCDAGSIPFHPHWITKKQLQVFGAWSSEPRHMHAAISFVSSHQDAFPFASLVSDRFGINEASAALSTTAAWSSSKSVITPNL